MKKPAASLGVLDSVEGTWSCQLSLTEYFHYQNQKAAGMSGQRHHTKVNGAKDKEPTRTTIFSGRWEGLITLYKADSEALPWHMTESVQTQLWNGQKTERIKHYQQSQGHPAVLGEHMRTTQLTQSYKGRTGRKNPMRVHWEPVFMVVLLLLLQVKERAVTSTNMCKPATNASKPNWEQSFYPWELPSSGKKTFQCSTG